MQILILKIFIKIEKILQIEIEIDHVNFQDFRKVLLDLN